MLKKRFVAGLFFFASVLGGAAYSDQHHPRGHRVGHHGMLVFGNAGKYFMTHIPMFQKPHDEQLILQVELKDGEEALKKDLSDSPYSFSPSTKFSLDDLAVGKLKKFSGDLYEGSFETDGKLFKKGIDVEKVTVLMSRQLPGNEPFADKPTYYVVQSENQAFLLNVISKKRAWQSVLKLSAPTGAVSWDAALIEATAEIPTKGKVEVKPFTKLAGRPDAFEIETVGSLWCLKGPDFVDPCK